MFMEEKPNGNKNPDWDRISISPERYKLLPPDYYFAEFIDLREGKGKFGLTFVLSWKVLEKGRFYECIINDLINKSQTAKKGKIWQLIKAISGHTLDISDEFRLRSLIGKKCYINVDRRGKGDKNNGIKEYISESDFADIRRNDQ